MPDNPPRYRRFGRFELDSQARELRGDDGVPLSVTAKAFDTLCCLIEHRDRVVAKDELLAAVWPGRVVEENNLTQAISALRRAFGAENRYIVTVPGRGYRFVADLHDDALPARGGDGPDPTTPTASAPPPSPAPSTHPARLAPRTWLLLLLALLAFGAWRWQQARAPAADPGQTAVAVLPFRALSPGPADELLEVGLADTLIGRLGGSPLLRVRSLDSSRRFADAERDPLAAGRALGATYVVEGTTQRDGSRIRVNARVIAVTDGETVWSGTFDEPTGEMFALQDGIAGAVSAALAARIRPVPADGRSPCDGSDAAAYRAYLTGRYQLGRPSAERMREALASFRTAIDRDPACARAYAGMGHAYRALAMTGDEEPRRYFPLAKAAVRQSLAIDPDLADAYVSQGFIRFWHDWDWAGAEASFLRAIELNPSLAEARMAYAHLLSNTGRREEAVRQAREAVALDPLSPLINTLASNFIVLGGDAGEARQGWERALELDPDFWVALLSRSGLRMSQGDHAGAIADLERAAELSGGNSQALAALGMAHISAGEPEAARRILEQLERRRRNHYVPATSLAALRNALGDVDGALDLLEVAYEERDIRLVFLAVDARWNDLRTDPRFQSLAGRMALDGRRAAPAPGAKAASRD